MQGGVQVILNIDGSSSGWEFSTRPGAWHVILTNIFGNALKLTQNGYIHVSFKARPVSFGKDGEVTQSRVTATVRDTGCGMDPEYLQNELFTAFSQEDSMTAGNGLGLNITHRIVLSLGGDIQVNSQKGVGTEVVVSMTLDHAPESDSVDTSSSSLKVAQDLVRGKTVGVLGLGSSELDKTLYSSLDQLCQFWFGIEVHVVVSSQDQGSYCDFYIIFRPLTRLLGCQGHGSLSA